MNGSKDEIKSIVDTLNGAPLNDNTGMTYSGLVADILFFIHCFQV